MSYVIAGLFAGNTEFNHHLYILNIVLIFILLRNNYPAMFDTATDQVNVKRWFVYLIAIIIVLAILSFIVINIDGELGGSHDRFPMD